MAKKSKPAPKKTSKKKKSRGSSRYRDIQKILSGYTKEQNIHLGKNFNSAASRIYKRSPKSPLKFLRDNIDQLFKNFGASGKDKLPEPIERNFPNDIAWYDFRDTLIDNAPLYEEVKISVLYEDVEKDFPATVIEGDNHTVGSKYQDEFWHHLRTHHSKSPVPVVRILDTDKKTFVDYKIDLLEEAGVGPAPELPTPPGEPPKGPTPPPAGETETDKLIKLEQEKQKTLQLQKEVEQLQTERLKLILEMKKAGFSAEEIRSMIGK